MSSPGSPSETRTTHPRLRRTVAAAALAVTLGVTSGCAHRQPTNRQLAIGAVAVVGLGALLWLALHQCDKGASYCDNSPNPTTAP